MAKKRKRRRTLKSEEVPMSSMIDVVFLLLVFFVATYKEQLIEAHMAINMPAPGAGEPGNKPRLLEVYVLPNNTFILNPGMRQVSLDAVEEMLQKTAAYDPEQTVIIKVDPDAREAALIDLLDLCKKYQLSQLNVLTLRERDLGL